MNFKPYLYFALPIALIAPTIAEIVNVVVASTVKTYATFLA